MRRERRWDPDDGPASIQWTTLCPSTGKRRFLSRKEARSAARFDPTLSVFRCAACLDFHTGHASMETKVYHRARPQASPGPMPVEFYAALRAGLEQARREEDDR